MFADVALSIPHSTFEDELQKVKEKSGVELDVELSADDLQEVVERYEKVYASRGLEPPYDARRALRAAVASVFRSWGTPRARKYRELNRISGLAGTACTIQSMVYGEKREGRERERERGGGGGRERRGREGKVGEDERKETSTSLVSSLSLFTFVSPSLAP